MMNKKGSLFMLVFAIFTVVALGMLYMVMIQKTDFEREVGERQFLIIKAAEEAQNTLQFIDMAARNAEREAVEQLAKSGGLSTNKCGEFLGHALWNTKDGYCTPQNPETAIVKYFDLALNKYLIQYDTFIPTSNYDYYVKDSVLYAKARFPILIDIGKPVVQSVAVTSAKVGTDYALPGSSNIVTSCFGDRKVNQGSSYHKGVDFRAAFGDPVFAVADGTVSQAKMDPWGNLMIKHSSYESKYLHNSEILVSVGDKVTKGQLVARAGNTAPYALPAHIHFELLENSKQIDPIQRIFNIEDMDLHFKSDSNCLYYRDYYDYSAQIEGRIV